MAKEHDSRDAKQPRTIPGMRSDLKPQPKEDPDFGPGMEYESGDLNPDFTEADKIRERWKKAGKSRMTSKTADKNRRKAA